MQDNNCIYSTDTFATLMQERGVRPTMQRIEVLSVVANGRKHPSADEIYSGISTAVRPQSKTTIYNSLAVLVRCGLLRMLEIESGCVRYDFALLSDHSHFICRKCARIYDFPLPEGFGTSPSTNFNIESVNLVYRGLCPQCMQSN